MNNKREEESAKKNTRRDRGRAMSCICDVDDGEGPAVFDASMHTARKAHRCCECHDTIDPGELYEYTSGCWDGSWYHYKTCLTCKKIREEFCPCASLEGLAEELGVEL